MNRKIDYILTDYWNCAYQQGLEGRTHDDIEGTAQRLEDELQGAISALQQRVKELTCQKTALQQVVSERDEEIQRLKEIAAEEPRTRAYWSSAYYRMEEKAEKYRKALEYYARIKWFVDDGVYIHKVAVDALEEPK